MLCVCDDVFVASVSPIYDPCWNRMQKRKKNEGTAMLFSKMKVNGIFRMDK